MDESASDGPAQSEELGSLGESGQTHVRVRTATNLGSDAALWDDHSVPSLSPLRSSRLRAAASITVIVVAVVVVAAAGLGIFTRRGQHTSAPLDLTPPDVASRTANEAASGDVREDPQPSGNESVEDLVIVEVPSLEASALGEARMAEPPPELPPVDRRGRFLGRSDHRARASLRDGAIASVSKGRGGRSLAFKITLEDGTVGYYKPEQTFSAAHYYSEVAAYYLDRELGLGRVPPVVSRRVAWSELEEAAQGDSRLPEIIHQEDGTVRGAFVWWIPERLHRLKLGRGWERWVRIDGGIDLTPYQRARYYRDQSAELAAWRRGVEAGELIPEPAFYPDEERTRPRAPDNAPGDRAGELSDMVVFDYLTKNVDRWGGEFTNIRTRGEDGPLIYLDNAAGFPRSRRARSGLMDMRLHMLQRFRRSTVRALEELSMSRLKRRMARDPLAPLLEDYMWTGLEERVAHTLEYIHGLHAAHGDAIYID